MTYSQEHTLRTKSNPITINMLLVCTIQSRNRGEYLDEYVTSNEIRI